MCICVWSIIHLFSLFSLLALSLSLVWTPPESSSVLLKTSTPLSGDPGHYRETQTKQRNLQQSFQQLLLPRGWPSPWVTGQSPTPSARHLIDPSISGSSRAINHGRLSVPTKWVCHSLVFVRLSSSPSMDMAVCAHKEALSFHPDSRTRSVCESLLPQLSHDLIGKAQVKVYTKLLWIGFDPLWAGWSWTLAKPNLTRGRGW